VPFLVSPVPPAVEPRSRRPRRTYHPLIVGGRYGSINDTTELSYTEMEYDYAIQSKSRSWPFCMVRARPSSDLWRRPASSPQLPAFVCGEAPALALEAWWLHKRLPAEVGA
jgi:hypothetical protein